jgi:hypothetical protein
MQKEIKRVADITSALIGGGTQNIRMPLMKKLIS